MPVQEMEKTTPSDPLSPETVTINMGPQHPSTHGVLRLVVELDGEVVKKVVPHLGYLHRGMEKIAESMTYHQFIPYTDRLDYLAPLSNNVAFVLAVEKLIGLEVPPRCRAIRVLCCEIARISAHLLWLGTGALDLGAATVFFHTFRERETLYNFIEMITGTRLTTSYPRVGGLARDIPEKLLPQLQKFLETFPATLKEYEDLLTRNKIWLKRTENIGKISAADAIELGLSGPNLRASGVEYDVRKAFPYSGYEQYRFDVPTGGTGDCYDRYLVRIEEMRQSVEILKQVVATLPAGPVNADDPKVVLPTKRKVLTSMEELIHQFIIVTEGFPAPTGEVYQAIEAPKGELGFYIKSEGEKSPYRMKIRSPSFVSLQAVPLMSEGMMVSDLIAIVASLDPVMGEVDR
jgi:NADH-quinone oxidoreductase subunit D